MTLPPVAKTPMKFSIDMRSVACFFFCLFWAIANAAETPTGSFAKETPIQKEGRMALSGRQYDQAYSILLPEAQHGDPAAQTYIGEMYRDGLGRPMNLNQALRWLQKAADQGYRLAFGDIGKIYDDGILVPRDVNRAVEGYRNAGKGLWDWEQRANGLGRNVNSPIFDISVIGADGFDPQNSIAGAERVERVNRIYEKLNSSIVLPPGAKKGDSFQFEIVIDENRMITSVNNLEHGCRGCSQYRNKYDDPWVRAAMVAITEGVNRASPLPELPSWYSKARQIRVIYPREEMPPEPAITPAFLRSLWGVFIGELAFDSTSYAFQFRWSDNDGYSYSSTTIANGNEPVSSFHHINVRYLLDSTPPSSYAPLRSAWQYVRDHRSIKSSNREYAAIAKQLHPYLDGTETIGDCLPLNNTESSLEFVCLPSNTRSNEAVLFYFKKTQTCGEGFCNYLIYPLRKKTLAASNAQGSESQHHFQDLRLKPETVSKVSPTEARRGPESQDIKTEFPSNFLGTFSDMYPKTNGGSVPELRISSSCGAGGICQIKIGDTVNFSSTGFEQVKDLRFAAKALSHAKEHGNLKEDSTRKWQTQHLQPLLTSASVIENCVDLQNRHVSDEYILLCKLDHDPWANDTILLMTTDMGTCGNTLFCRYEILPLFREPALTPQSTLP